MAITPLHQSNSQSNYLYFVAAELLTSRHDGASRPEVGAQNTTRQNTCVDQWSRYATVRGKKFQKQSRLFGVCAERPRN